ncbi:MAG: hypothetical protein GX786_01645, partial [Clostridiales bacterium]|nr:hypothetical protein [Clostridiales bacterium]
MKNCVKWISLLFCFLFFFQGTNAFALQQREHENIRDISLDLSFSLASTAKDQESAFLMEGLHALLE